MDRDCMPLGMYRDNHKSCGYPWTSEMPSPDPGDPNLCPGFPCPTYSTAASLGLVDRMEGWPQDRQQQVAGGSRLSQSALWLE